MSAELENAFYHLFQHRPDLRACEANKKMLLAHCDSLLQLPTVKNLAKAAEALDAQLAHVEPSQREIPVTSPAAVAVAAPEPAPAVDEQTRLRQLQKEMDSKDPAVRSAAKKELQEMLRAQNKFRKTLPPSYTRDFLSNLPQSQLTKVYIEFGSEAVKNRIAGKN